MEIFLIAWSIIGLLAYLLIVNAYELYLDKAGCVISTICGPVVFFFFGISVLLKYVIIPLIKWFLYVIILPIRWFFEKIVGLEPRKYQGLD